MKRLVLLIGATLLMVFCGSHLPPIGGGALVLFAQSVPVTKTATWAVNPATQNVVSYTFTLDGGTPVVIPASACAATCSTPAVLAAFGNHAYTVVATNVDLSGGSGVSGSNQNSPAASLSFSLNQAPTAPTGTTAH